MTQEAIKTAERFTKACGRTYVTGNDMYYALMFEAHEFFEKNIEEQFFEELETERQHTYETEDEDDEESEEDRESRESENEEEMYTIELKDDSEKDFHALVIQYSNEWRDWLPEDPVKQLLKGCIDKTQSQIPLA